MTTSGNIIDMHNKLVVDKVSFGYEDKPVIKDINLSLGTGEIISILGPSGVGKSTLFNIIAGFLTPDSGKVWLDGMDITSKPGNVSYSFQKDMLFPYMTIEDNVSLPLRIRGISKIQARESVAGMFDTFGLLGTEKMYPSQLSGGMRQRAALFRTYMFSNDVCLLDEPFSALDTFTKADMHHWYLSTMEKIKLSTIIITHDIDEAILLSDRIYIISGEPGTIVGVIEIKDKDQSKGKFPLSTEFLSYKKEILSHMV